MPARLGAAQANALRETRVASAPLRYGMICFVPVLSVVEGFRFEGLSRSIPVGRNTQHVTRNKVSTEMKRTQISKTWFLVLSRQCGEQAEQ